MSDDPSMDLVESLYALCERNLSCHFHSNPFLMCVTCRAAHHLYLQGRHIEKLYELLAAVSEYGSLDALPRGEVKRFADDVFNGCYGRKP